MHIAVIGSGYVGLVSGACFAALGFQVTCVDKDAQKIKALCSANIPIYEPDLATLVEKCLSNGSLRFSTALKEAVELSEIVLIAVGTPTEPTTGRADLCYVEAVAREIAPLLTHYKVIVIKSTVPVGTGHRIQSMIRHANPDAQFDMISNPEFLREGSAVSDFMQPDRIIIGSNAQRARTWMDKLYEPLGTSGIPIVHSDIETAELIKYTANCFLATKIAFVNEIARLCDTLNANVENVMLGIGLDKRIGVGYLKPGPGYGGSCFPKDTLALAYIGRDVKTPLSIVESVIAANEHHKHTMVAKIRAACHGTVDGKTLAILGVAFKANTDDVRDSAALTIIRGLQKEGAYIRAFDPVCRVKASLELSDIVWADELYETFEGADAVVIMTEWEAFSKLDLQRMKQQCAGAGLGQPCTLIDLRNLYDLETIARAQLRYISMGRPEVLPDCATL